MKSSMHAKSFPLKVLFAALIVSPFFSCTKESHDCELWEVTYDSYGGGTIGGCGINLNCSGSRTVQLIFCGDQLKDATANNTVTVSKDQCCVRTMTFNRFIKKE
jgi:hypothetical protein